MFARTLLIASALACLVFPPYTKAERTGLARFLYELTTNDEEHARDELEKLVSNNQYGEAIERGLIHLESYPNNNDIRLLLLKAYRYSQDYPSTFDLASQALETSPDSTEAAYQYLSALRFLKRPTEAIQFAESWIVENKPTSADFFLAYSLALNALDRDDEAHDAIKQAMERDANNLAVAGNYVFYTARFTSDRAAENFTANYESRHGPQYFLHQNLGKGRKEAGLLEPAIASFYRSIELGDTEVETYSQLAELLGNADRFDEAKALVDNYNAAHGESATLINRIGLLLYNKNNYSDAYLLFEKARTLDPSYPSYPSNAIHAFNNEKRYAEAVAYGKQHTADPDQALDQKFFSRFAEAAVALKDASALSTVFENAFTRLPNDAELATEYIESLDTLDLQTNAIQWANRWKKDNTPNTSFFTALASNYKALDDSENEISAHRAALELDPNNEHILDNLLVSLRNADRIEEAITLGETALERIGPATHDSFINRMGILYDDQHNGPAATTAFEAAYQLDSSNATWAGNVVYAYDAYGDAKQAIVFGEDWLKEHPNNTTGYFLDRLADAYSSEEFLTGELKIRELAHQSFPDDSELLNDLLATLRDADQLDRAESLASTFLERFPDDATILNQAGIVASEQRNYPLSLQRYEKAASQFPENATYAGNRVDLLSKMGDDEAAVSFGESWLSFGYEPSGYMLEMLAYSYAEIDQEDKAIETFRLALEHQPSREYATYRLADLLHDQGEVDEANQLLSSWLSRYDPTARVANLQGIILDELGDYEHSQAYYETALDLSPLYSTYAGNLVYSLNQQGKFNEADQRILEFLASMEPTAYLLQRCGETYYESYRYDEALPLFEEALSLAPDDLDIHDYVVACYRLTDQAEQAISEIETRIENDQASSWLYTELGLSHEKLDQTEQAIAAYQEALSLNASNLSPAELLFDLYKENNHTRALEFISDWAKSYNPTADLYNSWGLLERSEEQFENAASRFLAASEIEPSYGTYMGNYIEALTELQDYTRAQEAAETYLRSYPDSPYVLLRLGELLIDTYQYPSANRALQKAFSLEPEEPDHAAELAHAFYVAEHFEEGLDFFANAPLPFATNSLYHYWMGRSAIKAKKTDQAIEHFRSACQTYSESDFYLTWLMIAHHAAGQFQTALDRFHSFEAETEYYLHELNAVLISLYQKTGDTQLAKKLAATETKLAIKYPTIAHDLVRISLVLGEFDFASDILQRRLRKYPKSTDDLIWLARAYRLQGNLEDALAASSRALAIEPQNESAAYHHLRALLILEPDQVSDFLDTWQNTYGPSLRLQSALFVD